jgi:arginyl-tRNA synthetase
VQYAHARCCSLLRLAHRQGLIKLKDLDFKTLDWQLLEPNPIPWLNDDQAALRLVDPAEKRLIAQILDSRDALSDPGQLSQRKLASALSNEFERFYSNCRIWGEVKIQTPKLAQARLGLVAVTQALLRSLLQDHLGVPAPAEL